MRSPATRTRRPATRSAAEPATPCPSGQGEIPMSRYLIVSADGHAGPPAHIYREYLDEAFRERFDEHQNNITTTGMVPDSFVEEWDEETGDHDMLAAYDSDARLAVLDQEGVAAEVL